MKSLKTICLLTFIVSAVALMPTAAHAQTTNKPATKPTTEAKEIVKKPAAGPFHGKLAALDKNLKTITVGKRTFHISPQTQIKKAGKPATLEDGVIGEQASGYVKPDENGNLIATKVNFGPKAESAASTK